MPWLTREEALRALQVARPTLYTYVSRGWIRVRREGRSSRYDADDVARLRRRAEAAAGHAGAAAGAMDFGAPVLRSTLTTFDPDGPCYRGESAWVLAERGATLEEVADRLWPAGIRLTRGPPDHPLPLPAAGPLSEALLLGRARAGDRPPGAQVFALAAEVALARPDGAACWERAEAAPTVSAALAEALGRPSAERWLRRALVLCADHELNPSAFAARLAASTGASDRACLVAALATFSGPQHGEAAPTLAAALTGEAPERLSGPGLGHPLYPEGDPRYLALIEGLPPDPAVDSWLARVAEAGGPPPNVDLGLVRLARALELPPRLANAPFLVGRAVGWLAHAYEQRASGSPLRPRATP